MERASRRAACWWLLAAACAAPPAAPPPAQHGLGEVRVGDAVLDPRAFAAHAALVFPEESREVIRSLLRAEFATREAERLGLAPDASRVEEEVLAFEAAVRAELSAGEDLDDWSRARYGRAWPEARAALAEQLAANQSFQLCVRAAAHLGPRARIHWLSAADEQQARVWARQLGSGADPRALAAGSLVRGGEADGSFAPAALRLPTPHQDALRDAVVGSVVGPLRFAGDRSYWVGRVAELLPAAPAPPPVAALLAELDRSPLSPLESRAWFETMLDRYTAVEGVPAIAAPHPAFVPLR